MVWLDLVMARLDPPRAVARLKERRDLTGLVRLLERGEPPVRHLAATALGELGDPGAVSPLLAALAGPDEEGVRWRAAEALSRLGPPAVPGLAALAGHDEPDVRWKAFVALGEIGDLSCTPVLRAGLTDPDRFVRGRAVSALARLGALSLPVVIEALEDPDARIRQGAAEALGQVGDPAATQALVRALGDPAEPVRRAAAIALLRITPVG